jgi:siroheme synthase
MLLTRRAARLLSQADVVVVDRRSLDPIVALAPPTAERIFVGRVDGHPAWDTDAVADLLAARAQAPAPPPQCAESDIQRGVLDLLAARAQAPAPPPQCAESDVQRGVLADSTAHATAPPPECAGTDTTGDVAAHSTGAVRPAGPVVVRLKSGDPFVCSRGGEEMAALAARGIHVEVTPGVSAATAAPLAAGMPRGRTVTILAGNDDPVYPVTDIAALADPDGSLVVLVGRARQRHLADALLAAGLDPNTPAAVVHAATRPGGRVVHTTLEHLGDHRLPPPATVVIGPARAHS